MIQTWLHDMMKHGVYMNLVTMRYKTLGYLSTVLKSDRRVMTAWIQNLDFLSSDLECLVFK